MRAALSGLRTVEAKDPKRTLKLLRPNSRPLTYKPPLEAPRPPMQGVRRDRAADAPSTNVGSCM